MLNAEEALKYTLAVEVDENVNKFFNELLTPLIKESAGRGNRSIEVFNKEESSYYIKAISNLGFGDKKSLYGITYRYAIPLIRKLGYKFEITLQSIVIKW